MLLVLMLVLLVLVLMLVLMLMLLCLVPPSRVGVVVYPRVASQLVGAGKFLAAARELAGVWLLASMGADVPRLVLQAVEGLVAERALVGTGQLVRVLRRLGARERPVGLDNGNGCARHFTLALLWLAPVFHGCGIE